MYIITILDKRKQLQAYEDARSYAEPKKGFQFILKFPACIVHTIE